MAYPPERTGIPPRDFKEWYAEFLLWIKTISQSQLPLSLTTLGNLKVSVEEGGAGGGLSQQQIRSSAHIWTDAGYSESAIPIPVDIVAGAAGGGVAQTQVRDSANAWTDVGYASGTEAMPVRTRVGESVFISAVSLDIRDITESLNRNWTLGSSDIPDLIDRANRDLGKVDIASFDVELPAGTQNIGDIDVVSLPSVVQSYLGRTIISMPAVVQSYRGRDIDSMPEEGTVTHFSIGVAGVSDIVTPSSGSALKVLAWNYYNKDDIVSELRFKSSDDYIAGIPSKGINAMEKATTNRPQGAVDEPIELFTSADGNVKGWICTKEV